MSVNARRRMPAGETKHNDLQTLIGRVYETIDNCSAWDVLLTSLKQALGAVSVVFVFQVDNPRTVSKILCSGRLGKRIADDEEGYIRDEPALETLRTGAMPTGMVINTSQVLAGGDQARISAFYRDWMEPEGITHAEAIGILGGNGVTALLTVYLDTASLSPRETEILEALHPHLQRALRVCQERASIKAREVSFLNFLDHLTTGVILLDEMAVPVYSNTAVGTLTEKHASIRVTEQGVYFTNNPAECERIRQAALEVSRQTSSHDSPEAFAMSLRLNESRLPISVLVTPLADKNHTIHAYAPRAAMIISDPEYSCPVLPRHLEKSYGLTSAEAEIALALTQGLCVDEIAANRDVSVATVRTQVRSMLRKTGVHRQMDIIRLLLAGSFISYDGEYKAGPDDPLDPRVH